MATEPTDSQEEVAQVESTVERDIDVDVDVETAQEVEEVEHEQTRDKREGKKEETALRDREPGKSVLPFARVQRIIKADKVRLVTATRSLQRTSDCRTRI